VPEKVEQSHIVQTLRLVHARVYVIGHAPRRDQAHKGTSQTPGIPDLLVHLPASPMPMLRTLHTHAAPHELWIEVNAHRGRLSAEQASFRDFCHLAGIAHVVGGLDEVIAYLLDHGYVSASGVAHYRLRGDDHAS
jgi:hypothetical protein